MVSNTSINDIHKIDRILFKNTDCVYLLPHQALRKWISNYTISFPHVNTISKYYTIMPHGSATLVFTMNSAGINSNLFGPIIKPANVGKYINSYDLIFIVEFQPAGYFAFSGIPQKEITNQVLPFKEINSELPNLISLVLETAPDVDTLINKIDQLFMTYIKTTFYQQEFFVANNEIIRNGGLISVKELSEETFYSERHLNRMFDKYIGTNTKSFSRLVRINKALHLMRRPSVSIQQVCMQTGFYDMPHFIHDFKSICGITPQEYRNSMSDFYSEIAKF